MATHLSRYFEQQRLRRGLRPSQLAALIGRQNISKAGSRIRQFELTGKVAQPLFVKLASALEIDSSTIQGLAEQDRKDFIDAWLKWVCEPMTPYLAVRLIPAVYSRRRLPSEITTMEEAEVWAASVAKENGKQCCLVWSRRISCWFDKDGTLSIRSEAVPDQANCPSMKLGKSGKAFVFGDSLNSIKTIDVGPVPIDVKSLSGSAE